MAPSQGPTKYTTVNQVRADEDGLVRRAFVAYVRSGQGPFPNSTSMAEIYQPDIQKSGLASQSGKFYVLLRSKGRARRNVPAVLAVYRIRAHDGVLKRLRRWPEKLNEKPESKDGRHG